MIEKKIPAYQYPTMTVIVDDSRSFLDSLIMAMSESQTFRTYVDPHAAIEWIRRNALNTDDPSLSDLVQNSATPLYHTIFNKKRFNLATLLIVDYSMPLMNGLDICELVQDIACKRVLLTGHSGDKIANEGYSRQLIDLCLKKHDPAMLQRLTDTAFEMQRQYFIEHTSVNLPDHADFLNDPAMSALFEELYKRNKYFEHYLFNKPNGILFVNYQGKPSLMVIETTRSLMSLSKQIQEQGGPEEMVSGLQDCKLVPFFSDNDGQYTEVAKTNWQQYCLPAEVCEGDQTYYWALFDLPAQYLPAPVYSYADFIRDFDAGLIS